MQYKRIVVKVGTNVLTDNKGVLDKTIMERLVMELSVLHRSGLDVILVSSGAVSAGRSSIQLSEKTDPVSARQVWAAVGQIFLYQTYQELFQRNNIHNAQVLATKEDFRDRRHYLNMKNCFSALLQHRIIPVVNENDVVSVTELMFTDNDELAGLIASMMDADALIILTNVDGVFDAPPSNPNARLIPMIHSPKMNFSHAAFAEKSSFGRGGMATKSGIAHKLASIGITVHIANGKKPGLLQNILESNQVGTTFVPYKTASSLKRWVAHARGYEKGIVVINDGAKQQLLHPEKASSLLPVGIIRIEGSFEKGDIIKICDEQQVVIGYGVARYGSQRAQFLLGVKHQKPLVHYDYLFIQQ